MVCPEITANALSPRHLERVMHLADARSIARVADALSCSPAAVSKSIAEIEALLDVTLFDRAGGDYRVTPHGEILSRRSRAAWNLYQATAEVVDHRSRSQLPSLSNKRIDAFLAIYAHRNLKQSALDLKITENAVYGAIAALESLYGSKLFERSRRSELVPTLVAHTLARNLKLARAEMRFAIEEMASLDKKPRGRVEIGIMPRVRELILPRAVDRLLTAHRDIAVRAWDAPASTLLPGLLAGDFDFVVGPIEPKSSETGLVLEPLFVDRFIAIARCDHPLMRTQSSPLLARAVEDYGWILSPPRGIGRRILREVLHEAGLSEPHRIIETNSFSFVKGLLLEGDWIALSTVAEFYHEERLGLLGTLNLHLPLKRHLDAELPVSVLTRTGTTLPPAAQLALRYIHEVAAELAGDLDMARTRMFHKLKTA